MEALERADQIQPNLEFVDLMLTRVEVLLDLKTMERYGPQGAGFEGTSGELAEPMMQQLRAVDHRLGMIRTESRRRGLPIPFDVLSEAFGLDDLDEQILMLAIAPAIDASFKKRIARFKDNILMDFCDVDLCQSVLFDTRRQRLASLDRFGHVGTLAKNRVVKLTLPREASSDSLPGYELKVPGRVVNFVLGRGDLDPTLASYCRYSVPDVSMDTVVLPDATLREVLHLADQFAGRLRPAALELENRLGPVDRGAVLQFCGPPGTGKTHFARAIASYLGARLLEVDCGKLAGEDVRFRDTIEDLFWQARLLGAVLVLEQAEAILTERNPRLQAFFTQLETWDGLAILTTTDPKKIDPAVERWIVYQLEFEQPEMPDRERLWSIHLPRNVAIDPDIDVEQLASQYELSGSQIRNAAVVATNMAMSEAATEVSSETDGADGGEAHDGGTRLTLAHIKRAAHTQMRASLNQYAVRSKVQLTLDDLILPPEDKKEIQSIIDAAKYRTFVLTKWGFGRKLTTGKGLVNMFCGEPGTGKTLCAEIIAKTMGLQLYQISIPAVMSKYIGETEKNIAQIFQTAKANHAMLLFDEADSLFTSRVKVETSVDKFSNMETNLLLQEIERFDGVIILTTNLDKQIDKAFMRRIQYKVTFPFPEAEYRAKIWEHLFPKECPLAPDIDWSILGKSFEISGGHIKNCVLRAAYRAACNGSSVTMETIRFAAEQECRQAGKLFRSFKLPGEPGYEDEHQ